MTIASALLLFIQSDAQSLLHTKGATGILTTVNGGSAKNHSIPRNRTAAKTTATMIATETFGSGTVSSLPAGWTSGIINGTGKWHWSMDSSTSPNSLGYMYSTTASNGWMIFDADSIQNDCGCAPAAWLQSPAYICIAHPTVRLNFEEYFAHGEDTCVVWVSPTPSFSSYTAFPVTLNNTMAFGTPTANPTTIHLNITAAAAGLPTVYIRYVFKGSAFFDFSWMIDDMSLTELENTDAGISGTYLLEPDPSGLSSSVFNTPLVFVDTIYPGSRLSNYGSQPISALSSVASITNGLVNVYTQPATTPSLPYNAVDTIVRFPGFKPATTGNYTCAVTTMAAGDADHTNDTDMITFNVTDTIWMQNDTVVATNYFINGGSFGHFSSILGTRFDVPSSSAGDTISGFGVAFSPISEPTNAGGKVSVQLYAYRRGDTGWVYKGTSVARAITAADTSSFTAIKWADFRIDTAASGGVAPFVLQPGTSYAAMVQLNHVTTSLLLFGAAAPTIPGVNGTFAFSDTSFNDGSRRFRPQYTDSGITGYIPFVRLYFGTVPVPRTGISEMPTLHPMVAAYPDPADHNVNISFVPGSDGTAIVRLMNMQGQLARQKTMPATAGKKLTITIGTADLSPGNYMYSLQNGTEITSGKIVVTH